MEDSMRIVYENVKQPHLSRFQLTLFGYSVHNGKHFSCQFLVSHIHGIWRRVS